MTRLCSLFVLLLLFIYASSFIKKITHQKGHRGLFQASLSQEDEDVVNRQVLEFYEPNTNIKVLLVGAMHYNPASIRLAMNTVESLGKAKTLAAVIIESCPIRWGKTMEMQKNQGSAKAKFLRVLLNNEMISASDMGNRFNVPVILGDQLINITNARMGQAMKKTVKELVSPLSGGWKSLFSEIAQVSY